MILPDERTVLQSLFDALKRIVNTECPTKHSCLMCGIKPTCEKAGKLYREVEKLLEVKE